MRISPGVLLVIIALLVPTLVQLRTVLFYFDVHLSLAQTALIGAIIVAVLILWAIWPENGAPPKPSSNDG